MSSDADGVFTNLTARWHPLFKDGSQVCNLNGAVSEEAWLIFISTLQSVRDEPFEDLSISAQNPLGGRDCIHWILKAAGFNHADLNVASSSIVDLRRQTSAEPL